MLFIICYDMEKGRYARIFMRKFLTYWSWEDYWKMPMLLWRLIPFLTMHQFILLTCRQWSSLHESGQCIINLSAQLQEVHYIICEVWQYKHAKRCAEDSAEFRTRDLSGRHIALFFILLSIGSCLSLANCFGISLVLTIMCLSRISESWFSARVLRMCSK